MLNKKNLSKTLILPFFLKFHHPSNSILGDIKESFQIFTRKYNHGFLRFFLIHNRSGYCAKFAKIQQ